MNTNNARGSLVYPAVPGSRRLTIETMWSIPRVGSPVPSPDGSSVVVPVTTYSLEKNDKSTRLWLVPVDGEPRPLTAEGTSAGNPAWSPDGTRIVFTRKPIGEEGAKPQLFVLPLDGGEPEKLTDLPLGVIDAKWLPDGSGLIVAAELIKGHLTVEATRDELARRKEDKVNVHATEDRVYRFWDSWLTGGEVPHLFHLALGTGECRDLMPESTAWFSFMDPADQFDISPDGNELVYAATVVDESVDEIVGRVSRLTIDGGSPECLTIDAPASCARPRFSPDGTSIVYGRKEDRYFYADRWRLYRYDRTTGAHEPWCVNWDFSPSEWSFAADGSLVFAAEADGRANVYTLAADASEPAMLASGGTVSSPVPSAEGTVVYRLETAQSPPELFRVASDGSTERITAFTAAALEGVALGEVRDLRVTGSRGEPVQSFVILPPEHDDSRPGPFVNMVHGGPHGLFGDGFHWRWNAQVVASWGYVVATPNFQGSTSWGNDFAQRIQGAWGDRPFEDVMAVTDALIGNGLVDPDRMAAAGGSYGGYMMSWIAGHTDRFRCIVNHAGVWNTLAQACASDVTQGRARSYGGDPWSGLDKIDEYNPARFARDMVTPMLVIHGEKDYRVPVTLGLECYGLLKSKGVPARLLYFPDENHWILKPCNSVRWYDEVADWLRRWLG